MTSSRLLLACVSTLITANTLAQPAVPTIDCGEVLPSMPPSMYLDRTFKSALVMVQIEVIPPGAPHSVVVVQSSGYPELDEAAVVAMRKVSCRSLTANPRKARAIQQLEFNLDDGQPIYLKPESARALAARGNVRMHRQDFGAAKADFDEAIRQNPRYLASYTYRAELLQRTGRYEEAVTDLDEAIRQDADNARALKLRAALMARFGRHEESVEDHERAMRLAPAATAFDHLVLGRALFNAKEFARSAESLRRVVNDLPQHAYSSLWLYLATARAGNIQQAQADLAKNKNKLDGRAWPMPVIDLYLERLPPDALPGEVADASPKVKSERRCEVNFYLAQHRMIHGNPAGAIPLFLAAERDCPPDFVEYRGSIAELDVLCKEKTVCGERSRPNLRENADRVASNVSSASTWCPPHPPPNERPLSPPLNQGLGWVKLQMRVQPGAVPVTDVRVLSEAGGSGPARSYLPRVRQWIGCSTNTETRTLHHAFVHDGAGRPLPAEGFGLYAFKAPQGAPVLPSGDLGVGVCPIVATLQLNQPQAANVVLKLESAGGEPVARWLAGLEPDREYMVVNPTGNRIEFPCKAAQGVVSFFER